MGECSLDIEEYLQLLVAVRVEDTDICESTMCVLFKGQAPIQLELESSSYDLNIQVYEDYVDLRFTEGDNMYYIYNVSDDDNSAEQLFDYLSNLHQETNQTK